MATCAITITGVSGQPQLVSGGNCRTIVTVSGTVTTPAPVGPCPAVTVTVKCQCGTSGCSVTGGVDSNGVLTGAALSGHLSGGQWQVALQTNCCCGSPVDIIVSCPAHPNCKADLSTLLPCDSCCPKITLEALSGNCNALGQSVVTFIVKIDVPPGCPPVTAYMDFGDGSPPSATHSFAPPSSTFNWTHPYSNGTWNAQVVIVTPRDCPGRGHTVIVDCLKPDCCPKLELTAQQGECDASGQAQVALTIHYSVPDGCPPAEIQVDFGLGPLGPVHTISGSGTIVETHLYPAGSHTGFILVRKPDGCPARMFTIEVDCPDDCCPKVSVNVEQGPCVNGSSTATFFVNVDVPKGCPPATVQLDFGDGNFGAPHSFAVSGSYSVAHGYLTGNYPAAVNVLAPRRCPPTPVPVSVSCPPPPDCCPQLAMKAEQGDCDADGNAPVTFTIHYSVPGGCRPAQIQLDFGHGPLGAIHTISGSGTIVETRVYPAGAYTATILVHSPRGCPAYVLQFEVKCPNCCPTATVVVEKGECLNGSLTATFIVNVTVPKGCPPAIVQLDFGDGGHGAQHSIAGSGSFTETHSYPTGSYSAALDVIAPAGCPSQPVPIKVECDDCCPDLSTEVSYGECDGAGNAVVTFVTTVTPKPAPCPPAQVQIDFGGGDLGAVHTFSSPGSFTETRTFSAGPHSVTVNVLVPSGCRPEQVNIFVPCDDCCPSVSVSPCIPDCSDAPDRTVEFQITVAPKGPPCPPKAVSFQMDFGDGSPGQSVTIPAGGAAYSYTETHTYSGAAALQDNNAELILSQPPECAGSYGSVVVPRCCRPKRATLCRTLFWLMSWAFTFAVLALLSWLFGSFVAPQVSMQAFFALAAIGVVILIVFLLLRCPKCLCGWVWRLLWRIFFAAGLLYAIFAACTVFHWQSVLIGVLMILLAFFFLRQWRRKCCVSECAWLAEIIFWAVNILAFVGFLLTHPILVHCQMVLFAFGSFNITVLSVVTFLLALVTNHFLKKCQ